MRVDTRSRRVRRVNLFDHRGFDQISIASCGEKLADFFQGEVNDLGAGFVDERFGGADHEFDVAAVFYDGCASSK